jgi:hypothetical protein
MGCMKSQPMQNPKRDPKAGLSKARHEVSHEIFGREADVYTEKISEKPPFDLARRSRDDWQRIVATMQARKPEGANNFGQRNPQFPSSSVTSL